MKQKMQKGTVWSNRIYLSRLLSAIVMLMIGGMIIFFITKNIGGVADEGVTQNIQNATIPNRYNFFAAAVQQLVVLIGGPLSLIWTMRAFASRDREDYIRGKVKVLKTILYSGFILLLSRYITPVATYLEAFWGAINLQERYLLLSVCIFGGLQIIYLYAFYYWRKESKLIDDILFCILDQIDHR